nr:calnexin like [Quercus suber]
MRVTSLVALGCYAAIARADVVDDLEDATSSVASVVESVTSSAISKPTFTPTALKAPFLEQFTDDWESRWQPSHAKKEDTKDEEWAYVGTWSVEQPSVLRGIEGDKGLVLKDKAAHHAISAKFDKPINNKGKTLVLQYEVKLQGGLECGGAYLKLLQDNKALQSEEFSNASPYIIMFGPDKCGSTNKVHFIFRHKNPKSGEYEEKHAELVPAARITKKTALYTLIVRPDQTFEIKIDNVSSKNGTLLEDFAPAVNPEKEIDDADDKKPEDWVENSSIFDPEAKKPEDWDEDAPFEIVDEEAEKPADWLENEPLTVPDPEAEKPEDWDDEEDGDWLPPQVPNPKCEEASGCGPWVQPMKRNPDYKGKWTAPLIDNPAYKGIWAPRKIKNPNYFEDKTPSNFEPMGGIGFELWTMQNDILFDNIYIGHSEADAHVLAEETFKIKYDVETAAEEAEKPKKEDTPPKSPTDLVFMDDPVTYIREKVELFITIAKRDPVEAVRFVPEVAAGGAVAIVTLLLLLGGLIGGGAAAAPSKEQIKAQADKAKAQAQKTKDQVADAVASGVQSAQDEVNKRTTRSSAQLRLRASAGRLRNEFRSAAWGGCGLGEAEVHDVMAARRSLSRRALQTLAFRPTAARPRSALRMAASTTNPNSVRGLHATTAGLQPAATTTAATSASEYPTSHEQNQKPLDTQNFLDNVFTTSEATQWIDLHDPATNNLVTRVPQSTDAELKASVDSAEKAFPAWKAQSVLARQQIMFRYVALIREHWDRLAASITLEQGKTFADAKGDVLRGLQVAETACGITTQLPGEVLEVAKDMETRSYREPLGVVSVICPFNFPAMIPLWSIPIAVITGNTCVIKPSERDPGAMMILAELAVKAGFPPGVINVVHGSAKTVDFILDEPRIKAVSFVGSNKAGEYIYRRASANGKRVQANLGAKNHAAVLPDCNKNHALNAISGAAFGAAGQRCMALSTLVLVGETKDWAPEIAERGKQLNMNGGFEKGADLGPVISPEAKKRIEELITSAEKEGATILLDGRGQKPEKYPNGNWVNHCLLIPSP